MQFTSSKVTSPTSSTPGAKKASTPQRQDKSDELVELPSTSSIPTNIISRHQLSDWHSTSERPFTVTSCTNFATTVLTATNVNHARRNFSANANSSSSRRSCSIVSINSNPIRRISPPSRTNTRALSFATQVWLKFCFRISVFDSKLRRCFFGSIDTISSQSTQSPSPVMWDRHLSIGVLSSMKLKMPKSTYVRVTVIVSMS